MNRKQKKGYKKLTGEQLDELATISSSDIEVAKVFGEKMATERGGDFLDSDEVEESAENV